MTPALEEFFAVIGKAENTDEVSAVFNKINARPSVSATPGEYNDPVGATKYYQFIDAGAECGFRGGILTYAHFYIQNVRATNLIKEKSMEEMRLLLIFSLQQIYGEYLPRAELGN